MANRNEAHFTKVIQSYRQLMISSRDAIGLIAVELFNESFAKQGQIMANGSVKNWPNRGFGPPSRSGATLLKKRGRLQRSVKHSKTTTGVTIKSDTPYSTLQNDGGKIKVTAKMRRVFWAMVYKNWQKGVSYDIATKGLKNTKQSQKFGGEAEFWFKMAMAKEIEVKARPFIYDTPELPNRIDKYFIKKIQEIFKA